MVTPHFSTSETPRLTLADDDQSLQTALETPTFTPPKFVGSFGAIHIRSLISRTTSARVQLVFADVVTAGVGTALLLR